LIKVALTKFKTTPTYINRCVRPRV